MTVRGEARVRLRGWLRSMRYDVRKAAPDVWHDGRGAARSLVCLAVGRHRWGPWAPTTWVAVPKEWRPCKRCGEIEYRGPWPGIRVEGGTLEDGGTATSRLGAPSWKT